MAGVPRRYRKSTVPTVDIRMVGDRSLRRAFERLEGNAQKKVARYGLKKAIKALRDWTRDLVPVKSGALKRTIKDWRLARVRRGRNRGSFGFAVTTGTREQLGLPEWQESGKGSGYYPMALEAGTKPGKWPHTTSHRAFRYMRDAFDNHREQLANMIADGIRKFIDEEWNKP